MDRAPHTGKNLFVRTFGCAMNVQDSARIHGILALEGYRPVDREDDADVVILNTCAIRDGTERKFLGELGRLRQLRDGERRVLYGVGGCVAQELGERLLDQVPHVDFVFGTQAIHRLPQTLARVVEQGERVADVAHCDDPELVTGGLEARGQGPKAFVTVMQGCNMTCTYCIVPLTRGREVYRAPEAIVEEARRRVDEGAQEIHLIGQTVNSYWFGQSKKTDFADLLAAVAAVPGVERLRFSTSHPRWVSPALIDAFAGVPALCESLHLPVQSGSDRVLRDMRRGYTAEQYRDIIAALRAACPEIVLSTDIIVGYPGETDADFAATMDLLESLRFDQVYSFKFSPRPGTDAAGRADLVDDAVASTRLWELQRRQGEITADALRRHVGSEIEILVEGPSKLGRGRMVGRTRGNTAVLFAGEPGWAGRRITVRVASSSRHTLQGVALGAGTGADRGAQAMGA